MSNKMNAADFSNLIRSVYESVASLKSCPANEIPNEARIVSLVSSELFDAVLIRRNPALEARRDEALRNSADVVSERSAIMAGRRGSVAHPYLDPCN